MKKIVIIFITFIAISTTVKSQVNTGFEVGANYAFLTGDSTSIKLYQLKPGIYTGIFWDITTSYKNYIQIGGFISQQGVKYKREYFNFSEKITDINKHNIIYLKIPITWKQMWGDWYTSLGMYGELAVASKSRWIKMIGVADSTSVKKGPLQSFTNKLRQFDAGLNLSVGTQIPLNRNFDIFFKASYNHGFLFVNTETHRVENRLYNRFFTTSVGLIINKNRYKYRK